jgi:DNA (cytosine-5)-methyltransferase 1
MRTFLSAMGSAGNVIDLFAGAGGSALGFVQAGFRITGAAEIDPDACRTYESLIGVRPLCVDLSELPP